MCLVVCLCTAVSWVMEAHLEIANLILVYTAGVVYVGLVSARLGAWLAIVLSILVLDFVFVPPRWAFKPTDAQYYFTFASMTALGLLVSELALRGRRQAREANQAVVAAESERVRSTLLSGISHDFRTPLTTIVGAASSLLEQELDDERRRMLLQGILTEAGRLNHLTGSLLDLTRMAQGSVQPRCEWCPADELIGEVLTLMEGRLAGREVRQHVGPDVVVWCDPTLVEQVLVNLLENSLKHASGASIIEVSVDVGAREWHLSVADDGPGVSSIGEGERRFDDVTDRAGLGLSLCAAIARVHGGHLSVRNEDGARIVLSLPQPTLAVTELDS